MAALLLDTCAIIFIARGDPLRPSAHQRVVEAALGDGLLVSPISAWEIGLLAAKRLIAFRPDPKRFFVNFLAQRGVRLTALTAEAALDSSFLPPPLQGDPADRLLIATARGLGIPIVTRDQRILDYGKLGHIEAIPC
jgi:PIN domain nuclease of toxin-antitoxin system